MKLSILICSLESRRDLLNRLLLQISEQSIGHEHEVEYRIVCDAGEPISGMTTGQKRNILLNDAKGEYVCFIDDDDEISPNYINILLEAIESNPDCVSLRGVMTTSGQNPETFEHSIKYKAYRTVLPDISDINLYKHIKYERYPNHLNCIRASIAKQFKFPEINHGEDTDWATQIFKSGLIKTEFYTDEILYYYRYEPKKNETRTLNTIKRKNSRSLQGE